MSALDVIQSLAATQSRNEKEAIVTEAYRNAEWDFFAGANLAYDVLLSYGVAKVPEILEDDGDPGTYTFADFQSLAGKLANRELTGHAARDAIEAAAQRCHVPTWNLFYRRILLKDLNVGITEGTVNRALKALSKTDPSAQALMVPVFECQLAHNGDDAKNLKHMRGPKLIDIKLDGIRLLAVLDKEHNTVTLHMRDGKPNTNFPAITESMMPLLDMLPGSVVLDGEVVTASFQDLMTKVRRKGADTSDAKLALFDIIPLTDFRAGQCRTPQIERHAILSEMEKSGLFADATHGCLYVIPKQMIDLDTPEGRAELARFDAQALAAGYEGVMLKNPAAPYDCKRSVNWLKKKPKMSVTLEIVGFEQGDPEGKNRHRLGAFLCAGTDEGVNIYTRCGGGFTDAQRDEFWQNRESLLGMLIEVEGDKLTLDDGDKLASTPGGDLLYSVRFPVFKAFRGTVPGEKL